MIRILYVDDEPVMLDSTKKMLEKTGSFIVSCALSGKEALEQIHKSTFDVVVADYQMKDITGLDLLRIIRNEFVDMPFIIFTGKGREDVVVEAYEQGVDYYVQKGGDARAQFADLTNKIEHAVEHRTIRKELARSEEKFLKFLQNFDGLAFQVNPAGRFYLLEGTVEETTGYPRQEFISGYITLEGIIHPDDRRRFLDDLQHLATKPGFRVDSVFRIVRKDGYIRWLHGMLHNICSKQLDIIHIQGALYDVTYLKSAQEELAHTEEKWRSIITRAPVIISVIDRKGTILFLNKTHPPKKPSDLMGTDAAAWLAPGQKALFANSLHRVFSTGETVRFETSVPLGGNVIEWLAHQVSPIAWDGSRGAALIVSTVITERKWLEQNLRESEEQYRAIVTALDDGIIILNPEGKITFGSPRVYDIFKIPGQEPVAGLAALDFIDPAYHQIASQRMQKILDGDLDAEPFEYLLKRRNGEEFRAEMVTTPLRDAAGTVTGLLALVRDISRKKTLLKI